MASSTVHVVLCSIILSAASAWTSTAEAQSRSRPARTVRARAAVGRTAVSRRTPKQQIRRTTAERRYAKAAESPRTRFITIPGLARSLAKLYSNPALGRDVQEYKNAAGRTPSVVKLVPKNKARPTAVEKWTAGILSLHNDAHGAPAITLFNLKNGKIISSGSVGPGYRFHWAKGAATAGMSK
jgi:hypothetical protein